MKYLSSQEVKKLWSNITNENLMIYIHSPFCKDICKYCAYKGTPFNKQEYDKYFNSYLLKQIDFYSEIINRNNIRSIYFGGGTPSLMDVDDLIKIKQKIPNWGNLYKVFEIHPIYYNEELIKQVAEDFDTVIIGVQSFDRDALEYNNRSFATYEQIKKLTNFFKSKGVEVFFDLITLMFNKDERDFEILFNDLKKSISLEPTEITIAPIYNVIEKHKKNLKSEYKENLFIKLVENLINKDWIFNSYNIDNGLIDSHDKQRALKYLSETPLIRLFNNKSNTSFFQVIPNTIKGQVLPIGDYWPSNESRIKGNPNYLGIGSCKNQSLYTYSCIGDDYIYCEKSDDNKTTEYLEIYNKYNPSYEDLLKDFHEKASKYIDSTISLEINFTYRGERSEGREEVFYKNSLDIAIRTNNEANKKNEILELFFNNPLIHCT
ncbi:MAG: radical SAM protein [bacterium]